MCHHNSRAKVHTNRGLKTSCTSHLAHSHHHSPQPNIHTPTQQRPTQNSFDFRELESLSLHAPCRLLPSRQGRHNKKVRRSSKIRLSNKRVAAVRATAARCRRPATHARFSTLVCGLSSLSRDPPGRGQFPAETERRCITCSPITNCQYTSPFTSASSRAPHHRVA